MELRRYIAILRRRAILIALAVVVAVGVTAFRADRTPRYTATSTLYVGANNFLSIEKTSDPRLSGDQTAGLTRLMNTFAVMIHSHPIAQDALDLTHVPRGAGIVVAETSVAPLPATNIMQIKVTDRDPAVAQNLSTGLANAFVQKISQIEPGPTLKEGDLPSAPVTIFERAKLPGVPAKNPLLPKLFVAGLLGLVASAGLVLLVEYLDITVKTAAEAERRLELPVLGVVPVLALDPTAMLRRASAAGGPPLGLVQDA
jgi:capsular polysaccharide biosynthesis protein